MIKGHNWNEYVEKVSQRAPQTHSIIEWGELLGVSQDIGKLSKEDYVDSYRNREIIDKIMLRIINRFLDNGNEKMRWDGKYYSHYVRTNILAREIFEPMHPINGSRMDWDGWSNEYRPAEYKFSLRRPNDPSFYTHGGDEEYLEVTSCPTFNRLDKWDIVNPPKGSIVYITGYLPYSGGCLELIYVSDNDWDFNEKCIRWSIHSYLVSLSEDTLKKTMDSIKTHSVLECYSDQETFFDHTQMGHGWKNNSMWSAGFIGSRTALRGLINWDVSTIYI